MNYRCDLCVNLLFNEIEEMTGMCDKCYNHKYNYNSFNLKRKNNLGLRDLYIGKIFTEKFKISKVNNSET